LCNTFISSKTINHHRKLAQQPQGNDSLDFKPFVPNYQSTNFMPVISNIHQVKDSEFGHTYISSNLEQLEIYSTFCSKCSIANRYFAYPQPFVQDRYKRSYHLQIFPEDSTPMDIQLYANFTEP